MISFVDFRKLVTASCHAWSSDRAMSMGAALAFYAIFSLAPMLLLIIAVAGLAFGREASQSAVIDQIAALIGSKGAEAVSGMLTSASAVGSGVLATVIGLGTFVIFATSALVELQDDLNIIWRSKQPASSTFVTFLRSRFASLSLIVATGFLLLISLAIDAGISAASGYLTRGGLGVLIEATNLAVSLCISVVLFALIFKLLPSARIEWNDVWVGAAATGALFQLGKILIGSYLGHTSVASSFGAAGSVITILLWIYYSSQIVLFGAELTKVYTELHGSRSKGNCQLPAGSQA